MEALALGVWYFVLYSFAGWLYEFVLNLVIYRRLRWHGFLRLPILPIYGFGAFAILGATYAFAEYPLAVFLVAAVVATALEWVTSTALENFFNIKLWDYTNLPLDIKGRISLFSTIAFGLLGIVLMYWLHPWIVDFVGGFSSSVISIAGLTMLGFIILDCFNSLASLTFIRRDFNRSVAETFDDLQDYVNERMGELNKAKKSLRALARKIEGANIKALKRAFPGVKLAKLRKYPK